MKVTRNADGRLTTEVAICTSCFRQLHEHAQDCPLIVRAKLAEYRVRFEMPEGITELRADAALEIAERLVRSELQGMVDVCPALAGFRLVVERIDE